MGKVLLVHRYLDGSVVFESVPESHSVTTRYLGEAIESGLASVKVELRGSEETLVYEVEGPKSPKAWQMRLIERRSTDGQ